MPRYPVNQRIKVAGQVPFGQPDPNAKHGYHAGDDSANGTGTPVYAPASGKVFSTAEANTNQGIAVQIFDGKYYPHVFHLSKRLVNVGESVSESQLIGYTGNTGLSTGPHIHFGVGKMPYQNTRSINDYIDPMEYIKQQEEPMFNKGDAVNLSKYFLGHESPPPVFMEQIGKPWKEALENIMRSDVDMNYVKANKGDNENVKQALGFTGDSDPNLIGQPWKSVVYNYMLPKIPESEGDLKPVQGVQYNGKQTFVKE